MDHGLLIFQFNSSVIRRQVYQCVKAFLLGRIFNSRTNDRCSTKFDLMSLVLQESVLGPLLFLLVVNDDFFPKII